MDIPALSMALSQTRLQDAVGTAMLSKTLELSETFGENMEAMLGSPAPELSAEPYLGNSIDISI